MGGLCGLPPPYTGLRGFSNNHCKVNLTPPPLHPQEGVSSNASASGCHTAPPPRQFGGHSCGIPQWVIMLVQPLMKKSFWDTKMSPNKIFDFDPSTSPGSWVPLLKVGG